MEQNYKIINPKIFYGFCMIELKVLVVLKIVSAVAAKSVEEGEV